MLHKIKFPLLICTRFASRMTKIMRKSKLIPDVIDFAPESPAEIIYPSGDRVEFGNELTPRNVKCQPKVKWNACKDLLYTICMVDPDAPSRKNPKFAEWNHWLVGNIPGDKIEAGEILAEYIGSAPPKGTGLHRYVFMIYEQNSQLIFAGPRLLNNSAEKRAGFNLRRFVCLYNLGDPVAGNFFQAKYDDYVPVAYKKLGL